MSDDDKIRDLPSIKTAAQNAKTLSDLQTIYQEVKPLFNVLGIDTTTIESTLESAQDPDQLVEDLETIPDKFNEIFLSHGWLAYGNMNFNMMKRAVNIAERDSEEFSRDDQC